MCPGKQWTQLLPFLLGALEFTHSSIASKPNFTLQKLPYLLLIQDKN